MSDGRTAGPVGRILRLLAGAALTVHSGQHVLSGGTTQNLQAAGVVVGLFAFYLGVQLAVSKFVPSVNAWLGAVVAVAPAMLVFAILDPSLKFAVVLYIGVSLLATAVRADGGCEVMTLPGMLMGKRTHLVCLVFSPMDWVEEKLVGLKSTDADSDLVASGQNARE